MSKDITVYVEAVNPGTPTYGNTNITVGEQHPLRSEFLMNCRTFFIDNDEPETADKFYQAVNQTPSS